MGESQQRQDQEQQPAKLTQTKVILAVLAAVVLSGTIPLALWFSGGSASTVRIDDPSAKPMMLAPGQPRPLPPLSQQLRPTILPGLALERPAGTVFPQNDGSFELAGIRFCVIHYDPAWRGMDQVFNFNPALGYPRRAGGTWEVQGQWGVFNGVFDYQQTLQRIDPQTVVYQTTVKNEPGIQTMGLSMGVRLPVTWYAGQQIIVDGRRVQLPAQQAGQLFPGQLVQRLQFATPDGQTILEGPVMISVQDNRQYGEPYYYIRIGFNPEQGIIKQSSLKFTLRHLSDQPERPPAPATTTAPAQ